MDIQIIEHIKETLSVVIQCNKIDDEVMRLKSHIESFDNKLYAQKTVGTFIQWLVFIGIICVLYFICIAIYQRYSNKQGEIYTQALIKYQQQRRNVNGK